jgi:hypothetical protein
MTSYISLVLIACLVGTVGCGRRHDRSIRPRAFISVDSPTVVDVLRYPAGTVTPVHTHP